MRHISTIYTGAADLLKLQKVIGSHPPQQTFIQVYCGTADQKQITQLRIGLQLYFPYAGIIGASSAGEIVQAKVYKHTIALSISLFDYTNVQTVLIPQNEDMAEAGKKVGAVFQENKPKVIIIFGCNRKNGGFINNLPFLEALYKRLGGVILAGGQAGGYEDQFSKSFVFSQQGVTKEGFVAAALSGEQLISHTAYNLGWVPLGKKMTVTKAKGNRLYCIDDIRAAELYRQYLGIESGPASLYYINNFPLMTEKYTIRRTNPVVSIHKDGSFELVQKIRAGEQVQFSFCDLAMQEEEAKKINRQLSYYAPEALFVYTCIYRMDLLAEDITVDMEALQCCASASGFFTFGEYFTPAEQRPYFFQQTMTILALSEHTRSRGEKSLPSLITRNNTRADIRRFELLKVLTRLVAKTTQELEVINQKLTEQAEQDGLTGLANRHFFDKALIHRLKEHNRSQTTLGLILLDVDFFKQFNDVYGHVAGDDCLRGLAQVLHQTMQRTTDLAFRYGGEEFGCILSFTTHEKALQAAEIIRSAIEQLMIPHEKSTISPYVTASLGVITVANPNHHLSPQQLIKACDKLLYQAKQEGRNRVISREYLHDTL